MADYRATTWDREHGFAISRPSCPARISIEVRHNMIIEGEGVSPAPASRADGCDTHCSDREHRFNPPSDKNMKLRGVEAGRGIAAMLVVAVHASSMLSLGKYFGTL